MSQTSRFTELSPAAYLAVATGFEVLLPEYRLAPEHPFPAALDDAVTCFKAVLARGVAPRHIAVTGGSSGGGLAMCLLLTLKQQSIALPGAAVGISPWVDLDINDSVNRNARNFDMTDSKASVKEMAMDYIGQEDIKNPLISPIHGDLTELPPLLLQVSEVEMFKDQVEAFADKASEAGVSVELQFGKDMPHVWYTYWPLLPEGRRALDEISDFLKGRIS